MGNIVEHPKYDTVELETLRRIFRSLSRISGQKNVRSVEKQLFLQLFSSLPGLYAERLYQCFDADSNGSIDFKEFLGGLAVLSRGSRREKAEFIFRLYDLDGNGTVTGQELRSMLFHIPKSVFLHTQRKLRSPTLSLPSPSNRKEGEEEDVDDTTITENDRKREERVSVDVDDQLPSSVSVNFCLPPIAIESENEENVTTTTTTTTTATTITTAAATTNTTTTKISTADVVESVCRNANVTDSTLLSFPDFLDFLEKTPQLEAFWQQIGENCLQLRLNHNADSHSNVLKKSRRGSYRGGGKMSPQSGDFSRRSSIGKRGSYYRGERRRHSISDSTTMPEHNHPSPLASRSTSSGFWNGFGKKTKKSNSTRSFDADENGSGENRNRRKRMSWALRGIGMLRRGLSRQHSSSSTKSDDSDYWKSPAGTVISENSFSDVSIMTDFDTVPVSGDDENIYFEDENENIYSSNSSVLERGEVLNAIEGYLWKRSRKALKFLIDRWHERWCVLHGNMLYEYKDREDTLPCKVYFVDGCMIKKLPGFVKGPKRAYPASSAFNYEISGKDNVLTVPRKKSHRRVVSDSQATLENVSFNAISIMNEQQNRPSYNRSVSEKGKSSSDFDNALRRERQFSNATDISLDGGSVVTLASDASLRDLNLSKQKVRINDNYTSNASSRGSMKWTSSMNFSDMFNLKKNAKSRNELLWGVIIEKRGRDKKEAFEEEDKKINRGFRRILFATSEEMRDEWWCALRHAAHTVSLEEKYEYISQIGRGRFASVFKCRCKMKDFTISSDNEISSSNSTEYFAVKILTGKENGVNWRQKQMEIATMKVVDHPNVVRLRESFTGALPKSMMNEYGKGYGLFIVMDLSEDGTLADRIKEKMTWSENEVCTVIQSILRGLAHLHNLSIVHCDLKPANVLCSADLSMVKLTDLGLSRWTMNKERGTSPPSSCGGGDGGGGPESNCQNEKFSIGGTISYVAPEVVWNKSFQHEADVWAVGVIFFQLLRGKLPFQYRSVEQLKRTMMPYFPTDKKELELKKLKSLAPTSSLQRTKSILKDSAMRLWNRNSEENDFQFSDSEVFTIEKNDEIELKSFENNFLKLSDRVWMKRSPMSRALVLRLLNIKSSQRCNAKEALKDPFFITFKTPQVKEEKARHRRHSAPGLFTGERRSLQQRNLNNKVEGGEEKQGQKRLSVLTDLGDAFGSEFDTGKLDMVWTPSPKKGSENGNFSSPGSNDSLSPRVRKAVNAGRARARTAITFAEASRKVMNMQLLWLRKSWKNVVVDSGACYDVTVAVKAKNPLFWDWEMTVSNEGRLKKIGNSMVPSFLQLDIKFSVYFERKKKGNDNIEEEREKSEITRFDRGECIFPVDGDRRLTKHRGFFCPPMDGTVTLLFDNMYSMVCSKDIRYRLKQAIKTETPAN
eukprot:g4388.t1